MIYFSPDFIKFFKELSKNNHTEWFKENKSRYEKVVKEPFLVFVGDLLKDLQKKIPGLETDPKKVVMRINRDIRFSADKSPYKLHMGAMITPGKAKSMNHPGFYIELSADRCAVYGGAYQPGKESLYAIRSAIASQPKKFNALIQNTDFKKYFGALQGEKNKVIPAEFKEYLSTQPLIANKQFYFMTETKASSILDEDYRPMVLKIISAGIPLNRFFEEAMQGIYS
ncbi:MAG TPA: DUF2461 domain-containing protein [Chitinophagaceae bacterium]|nr:DUF2461 domain-containing protein [Chitinophagaceae bacterium]